MSDEKEKAEETNCYSIVGISAPLICKVFLK